MVHVAQWKKDQVHEMAQVLTENSVIGIVNVSGLAGPQLQKMRRSLRDKATVRIAKINLISHAIKEAASKKAGISELENSLEGQVGLIATNMNPFKLFKELEESKTKAPVKGGEVLNEDIDIEAGETPFKPGPIVGELQRAGIPAAIEQGKVVIKSDKTLVKAGEPIPREVAQMLTRLEIYPLTVGLDLQAVFEDGVIFKKKDLAIDQQQYIDNLAIGATYGFNLAFNINYINSMTVLPLLQSAHSKAMNLVFNANIITPASIEHMLQKGQTQMLALAAQVSDAGLDDDLKQKLGSAAAQAQEQAQKQAQEQKQETDKKSDDKKDEKVKKDKDKKDKKEEKDEEVSEEEAAAGLGALFG